MDVRLKTESGAKPIEIALRLPTVIGRSEEAKIRVRQSQVSRKHCALYEECQKLFVRDLGSSNGTFVNAERITETRGLSPGDSLRVGQVTFRVDFQLPAAPAEQAPSTTEPVEGDADSSEAKLRVFESSAVLRYREMSGGSFIGIDTGKPAVERVDQPPEFEGIEQTASVDDNDLIDVGQGEGTPPVAHDESALDRFLKRLDQ